MRMTLGIILLLALLTSCSKIEELSFETTFIDKKLISQDKQMPSYLFGSDYKLYGITERSVIPTNRPYFTVQNSIIIEACEDGDFVEWTFSIIDQQTIEIRGVLFKIQH